MIAASHQMVVMRNIQIPQHAMEKFSPVMRVHEIFVARLEVDRQSGFAYGLRIRSGPIRWIIRLDHFRVARRTDQLRRTSRWMMNSVARADLLVVQTRLENRLY